MTAQTDRASRRALYEGVKSEQDLTVSLAKLTHTERQRERDKERQRQRETNRERQTDRDKQRERDRERQME